MHGAWTRARWLDNKNKTYEDMYVYDYKINYGETVKKG